MRWACRRARNMPSADPEALRNLDDFWIHGRHLSGRLIAAEVSEVVKQECCVWDLETGDLVWRPRATSISWSHDGATVALLVGEYGDDFELRSWPERELHSRCLVRPWACCNTYVALSPRGDRAAVLWWHQTEGGVNLVSLENGAARHLESQGYTTRETNAVQGPTFSPDGGSSRSRKASCRGGFRNRSRLLKPSRLRAERSNGAASPSSTSIQVPPPVRRLRRCRERLDATTRCLGALRALGEASLHLGRRGPALRPSSVPPAGSRCPSS